MRRRSFMQTVGVAAAAASAAAPSPADAQTAQTTRNGRLKIAAVEIWKVEGHEETLRGVDHQFQCQAIHIYDEYRPQPYKDSPNPEKVVVPTMAYYLKIKTDAGLEGIYGPVDKDAAIVVQQQLTPYLLGKDPLAIEKLWDELYRSYRHARHGLFMMAISAVDNALWDLKGHYFEAPVYRLLGGPTRSPVEPYASCLGFSLEPEKVRQRALEFKQQGFRHQKWFMAYGPGSGAEGMKKNVELVQILRETVGDDTELMFDSFMGWDLDYAIAVVRQIEKYRPMWMEEPFATEKIDSFAELRRASSVPVASGEHVYGRWEAHKYLSAHAVHVLQCDPEWTGGVSELTKICHVASVFDVRVIPHGHALHAPLHVVASQSPMTCPLVEYLVTKMRDYYHFEKYPLQLVGARFALPERPGFGIELDPAKVEKQTLQQWT